MRFGSVAVSASATEARALEVGGENPVEEAIRSARRFLGDTADAGSARQRHVARVGMQVAGDQLQQRRFARAVAADEAHPMAFGDGRGGAFEDRLAFDVERQIVDMQHGPRRIASRRAIVTRARRDQPDTTGFRVSNSSRS